MDPRLRATLPGGIEVPVPTDDPPPEPPGIRTLARRKRVIVVGGGFGGLATARSLASQDLDVVLIDKSNHHLFQPLLYQVATAVLTPADITMPIRGILRKQKNVRVVLGEVTGIDTARRRVALEGPWGHGDLGYDWLVLAAGARHSYFGNDQWEQAAPGLKTLDDALEIRRKVFVAYESAEWTTDPAERRRQLTFVVVGAGPTGVEIAGALSEIARKTLVEDFRNIDSAEARVVLVEGGDTVLRSYPDDLRASALQQLRDIGVEVRLNALVADIDEAGVQLRGDGEVPGERIDTATVIWAAGVQASGLGADLPAERDRAGRVKVGPDLSLAGHPEVFVIGDMSHIPGPDGQPLPGVAQVAIQGGVHVGAAIRADVGRGSRPTFRYKDLGSMATIGRSKAIAWIGRFKLQGFFAWWVWLFVHLMALVGFRNRLVVLGQWAFSYLTWQRASRLIRTPQLLPVEEPAEA